MENERKDIWNKIRTLIIILACFDNFAQKIFFNSLFIRIDGH